MFRLQYQISIKIKSVDVRTNQRVVSPNGTNLYNIMHNIVYITVLNVDANDISN